ncbi:putative disease resistance protein RGA4 [Dendrobium catenatum]|uniref:putative disease resistance protein RGA4 n=1 Tax=Dendrobium catenatum TaxID=906689 RepID=UPI0010A08285|nr:putative disease resistance protein RGA4 [Dendrobium catenatum]
MFPQDYQFDKDNLVRMWIALGFIQPSLDQEETMEDIGGRYFDVLVKKSFFEKFEYENFLQTNSPYYYKMHDLLHELAQSVSIQEYLRVEDSIKLSSIIPETLRHLSIQTSDPDILRKIEKFKHLHSLFFFYKDYNQDLCSGALIEILKASKSLRLLYVSAPYFKIIALEEIGNLIHLRYLTIFCRNLTMLPRSLSNLYHLQYIFWNGGVTSNQVDFLPSNINNLSNLRHVKLPEKYISLICGIGKLKSLQELNMFDLRDVSGYRIGELENMNDLCKLGINCLENVKDADEGSSAKLCEKRRLTDLTLCWSDNNSRNMDLDENVLDNLQPPKCLRKLNIYSYMGARSAIWMNNVNQIFNLEIIELKDCRKWKTLPPFGQLPFLKSLTLSEMPKVKWLESKYNGNDKYRTFPLLEVLIIERLEALEDWFEAGVAAEDGCFFPCLIELKLIHCPKLKELPSLPSQLKSLKLSNIGWKTWNFCSNSNPITLDTLEVSRCPNITSLPLADEIASLAALRHLTIENCPNLISLGEMPTINNCHLMLSDLSISDPLVLLMEPLRSIASLKKLTIEDNDELISFPNEAEQWFLKVSSSLSELQFMHLASLESLPSSLELSSLQTLSIIECPNLISLGRHREVGTTNNCHLMLSDIEISDPSVLLMEPLRSIASLKRLSIEFNDELVSFPNEAEQWFLNNRSSLSELRFVCLKSLESLPSSLESLSSLQYLLISNVPMLRELPKLPPSLRSLYIRKCHPELPNLPPSLKFLSIRGCHPELKERYREDGGSDRHKIAHIPIIFI